MMESAEVERLILETWPDARVRIDDVRGDGNHYILTVETPAFSGVPLVDQHRMVFAALQGKVGGILRGLTLTTRAPREKEAL